MEFELSEDQKSYQESARQFAAREMAPFAAEWDEKKHFPKDVVQKAGQLGFCGLYTKPDHGGMGMSRLDSAIVFEELAVACPSTTAYLTIHNMVTWMVDTFCRSEIRSKFIPAMAMGEKLGSYCLTEANSGSDAASLKTRAEKRANHYVLNGSKVFVSGGGATDYLVVMARTGDDGPKGISSFLVDAHSTGISFGENEKKMGWNSQPTRVINFENVEIPAEHLLGDEGMGFKIAMMGLDGGRINIATCSVGAAQAALNATHRYMHERKQFGQELSQFQALQFKVADMLTHLVASRQMVRLAASKLDRKDPQASTYCAMAKRFATDQGFGVCNEAIQLFGGYGYTRDYPVERLMRDSRVHQILEGTNEIMRVIVSRKFFADEGPIEIR